LEHSNKIRVLNIPGELLDTKMIRFLYCLFRCAALQITLGSAWPTSGTVIYWRLGSMAF